MLPGLVIAGPSPGRKSIKIFWAGNIRGFSYRGLAGDENGIGAFDVGCARRILSKGRAGRRPPVAKLAQFF